MSVLFSQSIKTSHGINLLACDVASSRYTEAVASVKIVFIHVKFIEEVMHEKRSTLIFAWVCLQERGLPYQKGYASTPTFPLFFLRCVYKAARVTRVGGLRYPHARVTLAGGLTFSLVNTL